MADSKLTKSDIRDAAADLEVEGRGKMSAPELAAEMVSQLNTVVATGDVKAAADLADLPSQPPLGELPPR